MTLALWNLLMVPDPFSALWRMIIRPKRHVYSTSDLGPSTFSIGGRTFVRRDLQLVNDRGQKLECSHYFWPEEDEEDKDDKEIDALSWEEKRPPRKKRPCVVYAHGSCSSRLEALTALKELLPRNISVFCLDLSGSGRSEGEYISLGHHEERDLQVAIQHLRESGYISSIGLWGRSMGAVASVLRASQDGALAACILDSPFSNFPLLVREVVKKFELKVPDFLLGCAFNRVRGEIQSRANFDVKELMPIQHAPRAKSPALFVVAKEDDFVLPYHTYELHRTWGGRDKTLVTVGGKHDTSRPSSFTRYAADFLEKRLLSAAQEQEAAGKMLRRPVCDRDLELMKRAVSAALKAFQQEEEQSVPRKAIQL